MKTITINDFAFYCTDDRFFNVKIYDIEKSEYAFIGTMYDAKMKYGYATIQSYEPIPEIDANDDEEYFIINIDSVCTNVYK